MKVTGKDKSKRYLGNKITKFGMTGLGGGEKRKDNPPKVLALETRLMVVCYCWLGMEVGVKKSSALVKEH